MHHKIKRTYFLTHSPINIYFKKNSANFVVDEVPLYEFSGEGEHLILHIRKKDITTWDMIQKLSEISGAKVREFGYAGMKDKDALTTQYISIHKNYEEKLSNLDLPNIKILSSTYHNNKIRIGHLKGNKFFVRFKKVNPVNNQKLSSALESISSLGMPNYFGFQRFGRDGKNYELGQKIIEGTLRERNRKKRDLFINAYQSKLFNDWLSFRILISQMINDNVPVEYINKEYGLNLTYTKQSQFLKIFNGDILGHYPFGKVFECTDLASEIIRCEAHEISLMGRLAGQNRLVSTNEAAQIEAKIIQNPDNINGSFRYSWIYPSNIHSNYKEEKMWFEFGFELPKGSYATTFIEEVIKNNIEL